MNELKTGIVSNFVSEKNFGFIRDIETSKEYFFFLDKKEQIQLRKEGGTPIAYVRKGDVLKFYTRISQKNNRPEEAHNLIFINNPHVDLIKSDIERTGARSGSIHITNDGYYVNDQEFGISFPVKILHTERDFLDFDFLNKEPIVEYILEQRKNPTKIYAKLTM